MKCPKCFSKTGNCPECGKAFKHGTASNCDNPECIKVNAPIDCVCGYVVSSNADGILDLDMNFHSWV